MTEGYFQKTAETIPEEWLITDITDEMTRGYLVKGGTRRRWPLNVFYNMLDLSGINLHVLHNQGKHSREIRLFLLLIRLMGYRVADQGTQCHGNGLRALCYGFYAIYDMLHVLCCVFKCFVFYVMCCTVCSKLKFLWCVCIMCFNVVLYVSLVKHKLKVNETNCETNIWSWFKWTQVGAKQCILFPMVHTASHQCLTEYILSMLLSFYELYWSISLDTNGLDSLMSLWRCSRS